jgi:hypothetical protein
LRVSFRQNLSPSHLPIALSRAAQPRPLLCNIVSLKNNFQRSGNGGAPRNCIETWTWSPCVIRLAQKAFYVPTEACRMAQLTVVYWRDIPAQVIVRAGRRSARRELPLRFTEAIDMSAMQSGVSGSDAYLAEWRRGDPVEVTGEIEAEADRAVAQIERDFPRERLLALVRQGGRTEGGTA